MAAKFLILTTSQIESRVAISAIESYTYTRAGSGAAIFFKGKPTRDYLTVEETPEEIDEMLLYAEYATASVVRKSDVEKDKKRFDSFAVLAAAVMANEDKRRAGGVNGKMEGQPGI